MFTKILIANRGEIAVRVVRTCREMGIRTVALYDASDQGSLHVRLADECVQLPDPLAFNDAELILAIARARGADAVHPGYGFLAEDEAFIRACETAGIAFIGPPSAVVATLRNKIHTLELARTAGIRTVAHSPSSYAETEYDALAAAAEALGYPLVLKSCRGGRGRGERLVTETRHLREAVRSAQAETQSVHGNRQLYLERAILAAHQVGVQVAADGHGGLVHFGEREGSIILSNRKIIEEAPALCLTPERRAELLATAVRLARLVNYQNLGTVEFLVDEAGEFYFAEIKARIQVEHTLTEMLTRVDLVREQIRLAAGEALGYAQDDVAPRGWALQCRILAQDPAQRHLAGPGRLRRVRLPSGPEVRVDTHIYSNTDVSRFYDPLLGRVTVWAPDREACVARLQRALAEFYVLGVPTNLPLLQQLLRQPAFTAGDYDTDLLRRPLADAPAGDAEITRHDLAAAAAVLYSRRREAFSPQTPAEWSSGWHRTSRQLP